MRARERGRVHAVRAVVQQVLARCSRAPPQHQDRSDLLEVGMVPKHGFDREFVAHDPHQVHVLGVGQHRQMREEPVLLQQDEQVLAAFDGGQGRPAVQLMGELGQHDARSFAQVDGPVIGAGDPSGRRFVVLQRAPRVDPLHRFPEPDVAARVATEQSDDTHDQPRGEQQADQRAAPPVSIRDRRGAQSDQAGHHGHEREE